MLALASRMAFCMLSWAGCDLGDTIPASLQVLDDQSKVIVMIGDEHFTTLHFHDTLEKSFLYPIHAIGGLRVTRGFPFQTFPGERIDHPHQVGCWLNYGDVNGIDFWNNSSAKAKSNPSRYGWIRHRELKLLTEEEGCLETISDWVDHKGKILLEEKTRLCFSQKGDVRSISRATTLIAKSQQVDLKDNKEGFFALRVNRSLELPSEKPALLADDQGRASTEKVVDNSSVTGDYLSSTGKTGDAAWGTRAKWMSLAGAVEGSTVGVVILDHLNNPGYPSYWHARGYGLFAANPLGQEVFSKGRERLNLSIAPGEQVDFRFKVLVSLGELTPEEIELEAQGFATEN